MSLNFRRPDVVRLVVCSWQVPRDVLGCLSESLTRMLRLCLPGSFGPAGSVHGPSPSSKASWPAGKPISEGEASAAASDEASDSDSDSGWENSGDEGGSTRHGQQQRVMMLDSTGASRDEPGDSGLANEAAEEIDSAEVGLAGERLRYAGDGTQLADGEGGPGAAEASRGATRGFDLTAAAVGAGKGGRGDQAVRDGGPQAGSAPDAKAWPRRDGAASKNAAESSGLRGVEHLPSLDGSERAGQGASSWAASKRTSITLLRGPEGGSSYDGGVLPSYDKDGGGGAAETARVAGQLAGALRLQRLLYGLGRLHLRRLGQEHTRAVLEGLSAGLRYARDFQMRQGLRMALFAAG